MSTHRSCCCEEPLLYGLLVKQMRYRHDLVPHVEFPTKNFFFVKGTGVNTKGGQIIPELSFWFDPDDADRWKDANWQEMYDANPAIPFPPASLGDPPITENYYRTDEYGDVPDPRIGNNTAKTNGIAWNLNTIGVSFSEPIFLGTHEDLYVKGFAGGTGASFFKNGNIPDEIESSKTIDSELEIWNTLILPSSLSGVCVGNPDSIWNYIDRFCELDEDTGECTQRITSQIKNEGSPGVTLPGNEYNAIPLDRVRKYPHYIWDANRTDPFTNIRSGWTAEGYSEWYRQPFRSKHPFGSPFGFPAPEGQVFSGNINFFRPKNELRSLVGLTVCQLPIPYTKTVSNSVFCGFTGPALVYRRIDGAAGWYSSSSNHFKQKKEIQVRETPYWLWSEFDIPTMHLDDGILELMPSTLTPEYGFNEYSLRGDWRTRYNTNIQKRRPEASTVFSTLKFEYFDTGLNRTVGITATRIHQNYNSNSYGNNIFGPIFDVKGANTSSWKYRPIITEFYTTAMNHQCEMNLFFEKIEDAVVDGITFTYTRQRLPLSRYTSTYYENLYSPVRRDVYNNTSYTTKVGTTRTGAFNIFQNELIQYKDPRGITKHFNIYATDSSYLFDDGGGIYYSAEIRPHKLIASGSSISDSTEPSFIQQDISIFISDYLYANDGITYHVEPQEGGPPEPAHLHFVNTFFADDSIITYGYWGNHLNRNRKYNRYTRELFAPLNSPTPNRLWHWQNIYSWQPPIENDSGARYTANIKRPPYPWAYREPYQYYLQPGNVKFTKEWLPVYGDNESGECDVYDNNVPLGQSPRTLSISPCELPLENDPETNRKACPKLKYKDGTTYSVEVKTATKLKVQYSSGMENLAKSISSNSLKTNPVWIYSAIDRDYVSRLKQYVENNDLISIKTHNTLHNEFFKQCCNGTVNNCVWAQLVQQGNRYGPLRNQLLVIEKDTKITFPGDCNSEPTKNGRTQTTFECWINPDFYIPKLQVNDYGLYLRNMYTKHRMNYSFMGGNANLGLFEDHQWHEQSSTNNYTNWRSNSISRGWNHEPLGNRNTPYNYNYDPNEYVKVFLVSLQKISYLDPKDNTTKTKLFIKDSKEIEVQNLSTLQLQHPRHAFINSDDPFKGPTFEFGKLNNVFEPEGWKSAWPSSFFSGWDPVYNTGTEWELAIPGVKTTDEYLADSFEVIGDEHVIADEATCPGGLNGKCWATRRATLQKKNVSPWRIGNDELYEGGLYYKQHRGEVLENLRKYYDENAYFKLRPEWRVNVNYELWSTVENGKISFNNTPWGTTLPNNTEFLHTIRNLCAPRSRTEGLNWDNAVPVYYQIIPGATYYFKNGQKYPDPITNYYSDYSMFAWYFPGIRDPNPERFKQHSKNWWSGFNKNGIVMGYWNPCLYSKATPAEYRYRAPYNTNLGGYLILTDDYSVLHTDQWWNKNPFWNYPKGYGHFSQGYATDGYITTIDYPQPPEEEYTNVYGNSAISTASFHMSGSTKLHDSYLLNRRPGFFADYNIIRGFWPNIKAYEITKLNNYWLTLKQYAKDVVKCAESDLGSLECTKYFRGNHHTIREENFEPTIYGLTAYSDSEKVFRKACKKLVDHFGVTWPVGISLDQIQKEKYLNLDLFPVDSLHKMNKNEVYDFDFPKYVTTDPDFEAIFWKNSTAPARCCNSEKGSCFDGSYAECVKAKGTWIAGKKCSDPDSC